MKGSLKFILGFPTMASTFGLAVSMWLLGITSSSWLPDTALEAVRQLLLLAVVADFGLYWGENNCQQYKQAWKITINLTTYLCHAGMHAVCTACHHLQQPQVLVLLSRRLGFGIEGRAKLPRAHSMKSFAAASPPQSIRLCVCRQPCADSATAATAGHRVQHESAFLWRFHSKHHAIDTPSPFSTLFIHPIDAVLQVGILLS